VCIEGRRRECGEERGRGEGYSDREINLEINRFNLITSKNK